MSNLDLWERVKNPDPNYTKAFTKGGGFKGTATNATYLAMRATEEFGPCGIGWGVETISDDVIDGAPMLDQAGHVIGHEKLHKVLVRLWYVRGGQRGQVEQFGQTMLSGKNKNGFYTDEEAPKKSLTDAMTKCLSLLGFGAAIHLGLWDDSKYVNDVRRSFQDGAEGEPASNVTTMPSRQPAAPTVPDAPPVDPEDRAAFAAFLKRMKTAPNEAACNDVLIEAERMVLARLPESAREMLLTEHRNRVVGFTRAG